MIYDTFMFFNELDLLEIRLNELDKVVDTFVLVESPLLIPEKQSLYIFNQIKNALANSYIK